MATPTWAEAASQLKNGIKPYTDAFANFAAQVTNFDTAEQAFEGDFMPGAVAVAHGTLRGQLSSLIYSQVRPALSGQMRAVWDAWGLEAARIAGLPDLPGESVNFWARLARYMHEQSYSFNDRNGTYSAASAGGSNVGNGTLKRLTVDWEAYQLQYFETETLTWECVEDQNLGRTKGQEVFEVRGEDASKDGLEQLGSGLRQRVSSHNAGSDTGSGGSFLQNSSFDSTFSGSGTDKIPGWTIGGTASKITAGTSGYRTAPGASSQGTLVFDNDGAATNEVTQALSVRRLTARSERTPWMMVVAYKKSSAGATGTLNLKMGNKTTALDLSTIGDTSWHQLFFTIDKNVYYRNWKEDAPDIEIEVVNLSAGTLTIDDLIFAPWDLVAGTYWFLTGGDTEFLQRDVFTAATTGGSVANGEMMWSAKVSGIPVNLPVNNAGAETITDP